MAQKKENAIHYSELNVEELERRAEKAKQDLFKLRFRAASAPLKNPMEIRALKREVARLNTFMSQGRKKS